MHLLIVSGKIIAPFETRIIYRAHGFGRTYAEFFTWLLDRRITHCWNYYRWICWKFIDPVDDVAIRLQWSEYFLAPDPDEHVDQHDPHTPLNHTIETRLVRWELNRIEISNARRSGQKP